MYPREKKSILYFIKKGKKEKEKEKVYPEKLNTVLALNYWSVTCKCQCRENHLMPGK
jgi:hypothetical protein